MSNDTIVLVDYTPRIENQTKRIKEKCRKEDSELILKFKEHLETEGKSKSRICKYIGVLKKISLDLSKPFNKCKKEDIETFVRSVENNNKYSAWTKHDYKVILKVFFKWLKKTEDSYPEEVRWIKTTISKNNRLLPEEILTRQEIFRMLKSTNNIRDKALIECLYFSGGRISEILSMRIRHVQFGKPFSKIMISGKTGARSIQLTQDKYLKAWINSHPLKYNNDSPLWINFAKDKPISNSYANNLLKQAGKKAKIQKKIYPHLLRHSRLTELAKFMTESQLKEFAGWTQASAMASIYVHLSQKDLVNPLMQSEGMEIKHEKIKAEREEDIVCYFCGETNPKDLKLCSKCGSTLDEKSIIKKQEEMKKYDDILAKLLEDDDIQKLIKQKIKMME